MVTIPIWTDYGPWWQFRFEPTTNHGDNSFSWNRYWIAVCDCNALPFYRKRIRRSTNSARIWFLRESYESQFCCWSIEEAPTLRLHQRAGFALSQCVHRTRLCITPPQTLCIYKVTLSTLVQCCVLQMMNNFWMDVNCWMERNTFKMV